MEIIYYGGFYGEKGIYEIARITKNPFIVAQSKLDFEVLKGFKNRGINLAIYCMPTVSYHKLGKKILTKGTVNDETIGKISLIPVFKIPVIKFIVYFLYTFFKTLFIKNKTKKTIFISINYLPVTIAILIASRIRRIKTVCMLTDCARNTYDIKVNNTKSKLKRRLIRFYQRIVSFSEKKYDSYIFLTERMNEIINGKNKPYSIMEGIYNSDILSKEYFNSNNHIASNENKVLLYAGSLFASYGIEKIVEVASQLENQNIEFHFYGGGDMEGYLKMKSLQVPNIKYKGFVSQDELFKAMKSADILVNLRDSSLEYTELSFPSKMFEYMITGTPVLTTKLKGIPEEYYDYVFSINSYDTSEIVGLIINILSMDKDLLLEKGEKAKSFILNTKNTNKQISKIIKTIEKVNLRNG